MCCREAGEKEKGSTQGMMGRGRVPARFLFFDYCYFYCDTQREPLRRRELRVGARPKEGKTRLISTSLLEFQHGAFASTTFARPKKTPALQARLLRPFHLVQKPSFINRSRKKGGAKNFPGFQELFKAVLYMGESKIHCNSLACAEIAGHSG